jgi:hypothetical protein
MIGAMDDAKANTDAAAKLRDAAELYEQYLAVPQPSLVRPLRNSPEYVRDRAMHMPPLGLVVTTH